MNNNIEPNQPPHQTHPTNLSYTHQTRITIDNIYASITHKRTEEENRGIVIVGRLEVIGGG